MAARKKAIEKAVSPLDKPKGFRMGELGALGFPPFGGEPKTKSKTK